MNAKDFRNLVEARRAVRRFEDTPIPPTVIDDCLELAMLAPNSSNLQAWEFHVIQSPDKKKAMVPICFHQNAAKTAAVLVAIVARTKTWKANSDEILRQWPEPQIPPIVEKYYRKTVYWLYSQGPFSIFGHAKRFLAMIVGWARPVPWGPYSKADMKLWAAKSCSLAAENLMLALQAHGFDSCPMEGFDGKRLNRLLQLPRDAFVVMVIAAGKQRADGIYNQRMRLQRERFVFRV